MSKLDWFKPDGIDDLRMELSDGFIRSARIPGDDGVLQACAFLAYPAERRAGSAENWHAVAMVEQQPIYSRDGWPTREAAMADAVEHCERWADYNRGPAQS